MIVPRVKICGLKSVADIEIATRYGADAVGFITNVPVHTPRNIDIKTASGLISKVPLFVKSVMVIMPVDAKEAVEMIRLAKPDIVQIHSEIGVDQMTKLRQMCSIPIIKSFSVPTDDIPNPEEIGKRLIKSILEYENKDLIDAILLDSYNLQKAGGTGYVHRWDISRNIVLNSSLPIILAGGLNSSNVQDAITQVLPYGLDVSSSLESEGHKDETKVKQFMMKTRCLNDFI